MLLSVHATGRVVGIALTAAVLLGPRHPLTGFSESASQISPPSRTYALLIGVSEYPNLAPKWRLNGPANDVQLFRELLQSPPFSIPVADITSLAGWPQRPDERPTRVNIERAFKRLEQTARPDDQIVILMAGHGSQQPARADNAAEEPDGLDEIFLPADVAGWNGRSGQVRNAIVDDDLREWVTAIRKKGAYIWLVIDSCHSGTMTRGSTAERDRQIPSSELVPADVLSKVATRTRGARSEPPFLNVSSGIGGIAAFYAAQTSETTSEKRLPNSGSPYHGLFSYAVAAVLAESHSPLTYSELLERVIRRYRSEGRFGPNPMLEGIDLNREVLGRHSWPDRPALRIGQRVNERWQLEAGAIQGLTTGSIVEVFPPAGSVDADASMGFVRIVSVEATRAIVEPTSFEGHAPPAAGRLVEGSRGRVVVYDFGEQRLRLAIQHPIPLQDGRFEAARSGTGPVPLERLFSQLPERIVRLVERVNSADAADWMVGLAGDEIVLQPSSGFYPAPGASEAENLAPAPLRIGKTGDALIADAFQGALTRIARATNLLRLANMADTATSDISFNLELVRRENGSMVPLGVGSAGLALRAGDEVAFRLENRSQMAIDVTLLLVDSAFAIQPIFPLSESAASGRLEEGRSTLTSSFTVTADRVELDQVVAIAVEASNPPLNFGLLAQPGIDSVRSARRDRGSVPGSALQDLLERALFGAGTTRAMSAAQVGQHAMRLLAWRAEPRP